MTSEEKKEMERLREMMARSRNVVSKGLFAILFQIFCSRYIFELHNSATKASMASSVKCCITTTWASLPPKRVSSFCANWYL